VNDHSVRISAHRGGGVPGTPVTRHTFEAAVASEAEFVELDIRRTGDGTLVVHHGPRAGRWGPRLRDLSYERLCELTGHRVPRVPETLALIAGRAVGHLDLKETGYEDDVIALAVGVLGPDGFIVTTTEGSSIAHIGRCFPGVVTGLSLGHAVDQARRLVRTRSCGRDAIGRIRACGAHWLAVNHRLTGTDVLAACAANGVPCMVWTVNGDAHMTRFLADPRVAVLVTDRPLRALRLRADLHAPSPVTQHGSQHGSQHGPFHWAQAGRCPGSPE
jgi:glycerophosphoryl diester phosphodiesterase